MNETIGFVVFEACSVREQFRPENVDNKQRASHLDELCSLLFGSAADFANHDDALRLRVSNEALQAVHEVGAVEGVAADADAGGLAEAHGRRLENLLSQPQGVSTPHANACDKAAGSEHAARERMRLSQARTASYVSVPERDTTPMRPGLWM